MLPGAIVSACFIFTARNLPQVSEQTLNLDVTLSTGKTIRILWGGLRLLPTLVCLLKQGFTVCVRKV